MKEIKFRGKSKKTGQWVYGSLDYNKAKDTMKMRSYDECGNLIGSVEIDPKTVGQLCTTYKDRNEKIHEVYTDDILQIHDNVYYKTYRETVGENGTVYLRGDEDKCIFVNYLWDFGDFDVIGNLHDNPGLIKLRQGYDKN